MAVVGLSVGTAAMALGGEETTERGWWMEHGYSCEHCRAEAAAWAQQSAPNRDKAFNAATSKLEPGLPTPVIITAYSDRTFTFVTKSTPATVLLKKAVGITSGSKRPNTDKVGKVTRKQLEDIAKAKEPDLTADDLDAAVRTIAGSARSMGLVVEG